MTELEQLKEKLLHLQEQHAAVSAKQNALKVFMNSGYGALTNVWFRFFDLRLATSITVMGQVCIRGAAKYVEGNVDLVTNSYIDTDSNFYNCASLVKKRFGDKVPEVKEGSEFLVKVGQQLIGPKVAEFFQKLTTNCNAMENYLKMENEVVGDKAIFLGKKKYVVQKLWDEVTSYADDPKLKKTGIEIVRTSTPQKVRDQLEKAIKRFFKTENRDDMIKFIGECEKEFEKWSFIEVAFPRSVNDLGKYPLGTSGIPIGVRAAHIYNDAIVKYGLDKKYRKIEDGDKVKFCYIKEPNAFHSNVISCPDDRMPPKLLKMFEVDTKTQFEKTFRAPLTKVFEALDWSVDANTVSIEGFFE